MSAQIDDLCETSPKLVIYSVTNNTQQRCSFMSMRNEHTHKCIFRSKGSFCILQSQ